MVNSIKFFKFFLCVAVLSQPIFFDSATSTTVLGITLNNSKLNKRIVRIKNQIVSWIVPIFHADDHQNWYYLCYGVLIHPRVVLSAGKCFDENYPSLYAVGTYKWSKKTARLNSNNLRSVIRIQKDPESNYTTFESDPSRININRTALLILKDPIENIKPINVEHTLPLTYIYDENIPKECKHIRLVESFLADNFYPISNSSIFHRVLTLEKIITNSVNRNQLYDLSISDNNLSGVINENQYFIINNDSQVFFTQNELKLLITDPLLGSPILCRSTSRFENYALAGILTDSIDNLLQYTIVNNTLWIKENLKQILKTLNLSQLSV